MDNKDLRAALIASVSDLEEQKVLDMVRRRLEEGDNPLAIVEDC